jgi:hypothetical protein
LSQEEKWFLARLSRQRIRDFVTDTKAMRGHDHVLPAGTMESASGALRLTPDSMIVKETPLDVASVNEQIAQLIRATMKRLGSYHNSPVNLLYALFRLVDGKSPEQAAREVTKMGELSKIGFHASAIDIEQVEEDIKGRLNGDAKRIGDAMVVMQTIFKGSSIADAVQIVRRADLPTSAPVTFFRKFKPFLNRVVRAIDVPRKGR